MVLNVQFSIFYVVRPLFFFSFFLAVVRLALSFIPITGLSNNWKGTLGVHQYSHLPFVIELCIVDLCDI